MIIYPANLSAAEVPDQPGNIGERKVHDLVLLVYAGTTISYPLAHILHAKDIIYGKAGRDKPEQLLSPFEKLAPMLSIESTAEVKRL